MDVPRSAQPNVPLGSLGAVDLAAGGKRYTNLTLNPNIPPSFPFELINSTVLQVRQGVNLSALDLPNQLNVSVLITTTGEDARTVEKFLIINLKDKTDVNLTLNGNEVNRDQLNRIESNSLRIRSWRILMKTFRSVNSFSKMDSAITPSS